MPPSTGGRREPLDGGGEDGPEPGVEPGLVEDPGEVPAELEVAERVDPGVTAEQGEHAGEVVERLGDLGGHRVLAAAGGAAGVVVAGGLDRVVDPLGERLEPREQ